MSSTPPGWRPGSCSRRSAPPGGARRGARSGPPTSPRAARRAAPERLREHLVERGLALDADAGRLARGDLPVLDRGVVGDPAERAKPVGVGLVAAEPEPARDRERELVPAVRNAPAERPA